MYFNVIDDTLFILLYIVPSLLLLYCMLVSAEARRAVWRLPGAFVRLLFPSTNAGSYANTSTTRQLGAKPFSTRFSSRKGAEMFKGAVEIHNQNVVKKTTTKDLATLFTSSPPVAVGMGSPTRPLMAGSGNLSRAGQGIKRSASGLAKALPRTDDGFEESTYAKQNSVSHAAGPKNSQFGADVWFDENDFDSDIDIDLEIEAPGKGQVKYPTLPKQSATTNISPTAPRQNAQMTRNYDSGYATQLLPPPTTRHTPSNLRSTPNDQRLPWSSSPLEHFQRPEPTKMPMWDQFHYAGKKGGAGGIGVQTSRQAKESASRQAIMSTKQPIEAISEEEVEEEAPRPSKRRTLPWLQQQAEEDKPMAANSGKKLKSSAFTPLPKNTQKTDFPWNTTASAIKEQQKQLRQANKKMVKANDPTEADKTAAVASKKAKQLHRVFLSEEQQHVLDLVVEHKKSVFFTGSAGTGKSVLLREIITALRKRYLKEPDRIAVTASTGLAACNVGGVTLHSFAGIGLGKEDVPTLVKKIRRNQKAKHRWMRTKVLVVDEVSMVDGELFDKLEEIARILRNNGRPFGGIQLVITGDFFQLPPVPDYGGKGARFAFEAGTWNTSIEYTIGLHQVFRQKDPEFAAMLNEMREGRLSAKSIARFRSLNRELKFEDALECTELFPTRNEVDGANASRMRNLQGELVTYEARDGGTIADKTMRDKLLANCMAPGEILLKKGAQVMLIKNIDETLVNGSLGKVAGFMSEAMFDNYQANESEYYADQREGEEGRELSSQKMRMKELGAGGSQVYPVVRFAIADGSTRDLLCQRETWKVELPNGEVQASRAQIPLILAWALSIHKAQGQTLERVKVDLGKVFEKGQAYVALSRATSMKGLQVVGFSAGKVMAHEKVRTFYTSLSRAEAAKGKDGGSGEGGKSEGAWKALGMGGKSAGGGGGVGAKGYEKAFVDGDRYLDGDHEWEV